MCLGPNFTLHRNSASQANVAPIFDRILTELSLKMKRLDINKSELACLKAIILFNPGKFFDFFSSMMNPRSFFDKSCKILAF